jgi:hypothetical protein
MWSFMVGQEKFRISASRLVAASSATAPVMLPVAHTSATANTSPARPKYQAPTMSKTIAIRTRRFFRMLIREFSFGITDEPNVELRVINMDH